MGDEQDIDVRGTQVLGDKGIVTRENLGNQAAEHDQEDVLVTELVQEPHQRQLGAARVSRERRSSIDAIRLAWVERVDELLLDVVCGVSSTPSERGEVGEQAGGAHDRDASDPLGEIEHARVGCPEGHSATLVDLAQACLLDRVAEGLGEVRVIDVEVQAGRRLHMPHKTGS